MNDPFDVAAKSLAQAAVTLHRDFDAALAEANNSEQHGSDVMRWWNAGYAFGLSQAITVLEGGDTLRRMHPEQVDATFTAVAS